MVLNGPTNGMGKNPTLSGKPPALCIGSLGDCQGVKAYREILWQVKSLGQNFWSKKTRVSWRRYVFKRQRLGAVLITAATDSNDSAMKAAIAAAELEMVRRLGWIMGWGNECQKPWLLWLVPFQNSRLSMTLKNFHNLPHLHSDTQCTLHPSTYFFQQHLGAQKTLSCRPMSMRDGTVMNSG